MNLIRIWYAILLAVGHHEHVHTLISDKKRPQSRWRLVRDWRSAAKLWASQKLIKEYKYHRCPNCEGVTREEDGHLDDIFRKCWPKYKNGVPVGLRPGMQPDQESDYIPDFLLTQDRN